MRGRWIFAWLAVLAFSSAASAEPTSATDRALAQSLFDEGRARMESGQYHEACDAFARSLKLEPGGGTLLNLAVCHEKEGRVATAYVEHNAALSQALREGRSDREALARKRIAALGPLLPRVRILRGANPPEGLLLFLDGATLPAETLDVPLPIDPGPHVLEARAPGKKSASRDVVVEEGPHIMDVTIPGLTSDVVANVAVTPRAPEDRTATPPSGGSRRTVGFVLGGVGIAALGVGAAFGVDALAKGRESSRLCPASRCTDAHAVALSHDAVTSAWVADVALAAGLVAVGVGLYLVLSSPAPHSRKASAAWDGLIRF